MVSPDQSHFAMLKHGGRTKAASFLSDGCRLSAGALVGFMLVWTIWSSLTPTPTPTPSLPAKTSSPAAPPSPDSPERNFYDDPKLSYALGSKPVRKWDEKRREWLRQHPSLAAGAEHRIFMVTGSQAAPCKNPIGDHLLLKLFKNKVDYCRRHGIDIFYNNVLLQPQMFSFWAKTAAVRAAMLAHPEAEWIWWVDSDAAFTDMDFAPPLHRYKDHNMVVHGWPLLLQERNTWTGINAGVFLIRNCQWALDFIDVWASMGPQSPDYHKWGKTLSSVFKDKIFPESDDQSGLIYLYLKEKEKWGDKIYVEGEYYFEGYWLEIVGTLDNITASYSEIERKVGALRRRHAEKLSEGYATLWEEHLKGAGYGKGSWRRPFITHFTGCQPCSGDHNQMYSGESCFDSMNKALTFADNQVLRNYGFVHPDLHHPSTVNPLPFDYPA
ncbi:putative glycosyltransferase 7 [Salvia miltiorrhiza]|uniref:putative glycosyltransferase 7 n=1 Tax=Salvia miltiorrhiza TaxID=226208 RepID=UPI0025ABACCC|nr:putative glycosyltransferase 7 [Salvia miltiorrhiza]